MKYMGSKRRIAKDILPIILKDRKENQIFYDLFVGGGNLLEKVEGKRVANDNNKYLISLFKEMQKDDFKLPFIDEQKYKEIQKNKDGFPDWLVGYVGFQLSFGAKFFGGYRRDKAGVRNYENEAQQNLKAQQNLIKDVDFYCGSYDEVPLQPNSIIYCDIPYKNTTHYNTSKGFDYEKFYNWCIRKHREGHRVFISEYNMPSDIFERVWEKEITNGLTVRGKQNKGIEKLFIVREDI